MIEFPFKTVRVFKVRDLDRKTGQLIYTEPGDSDINEGNFMAQLAFFDGKTIYVIQEWDTREDLLEPK